MSNIADISPQGRCPPQFFTMPVPQLQGLAAERNLFVPSSGKHQNKPLKEDFMVAIAMYEMGYSTLLREKCRVFLTRLMTAVVPEIQRISTEYFGLEDIGGTKTDIINKILQQIPVIGGLPLKLVDEMPDICAVTRFEQDQGRTPVSSPKDLEVRDMDLEVSYSPTSPPPPRNRDSAYHQQKYISSPPARPRTSPVPPINAPKVRQTEHYQTEHHQTEHHQTEHHQTEHHQRNGIDSCFAEKHIRGFFHIANVYWPEQLKVVVREHAGTTASSTSTSTAIPVQVRDAMTVLNSFMGVARSFSHWYHSQERKSTLSEVERSFEAARDKAEAFKRKGDDIMESFVTSMDQAVDDIGKQLEELQFIDETF